jgi:hypothetical protein
MVPEESRESVLQICDDIRLWMTWHSRKKAQEVKPLDFFEVLELYAAKSSAHARGA